MKHLIPTMGAALFALTSFPVFSGPDESSQRAVRKSQERAQQAQAAARAEMEAMIAQCRPPVPGQQ